MRFKGSLSAENSKNQVRRAKKKSGLRRALPALAALLAIGPSAYAGVQNHAFEVDPATAVVCPDGAVFTGETTGPSAVGPLMTSQVFDSTGTTLLATGDSHTFTAVGEAYAFTVMGTFTAGNVVTLSVTDNPPTLQGTEGDIATATVATCSVAPGFSKSFAPNPIVAGGVSTLTFTIDNPSPAAVANLDFTDTLPAAVTIATPGNAATTCTGGTLTAPDGGGTITYTGGTVAAASSCTVSLDVTSATVGTHTNTSGDLTSDLGNSGTATDDLVVDPVPVPAVPGAGLLLLTLLLVAGGALATRRFAGSGGTLRVGAVLLGVLLCAAGAGFSTPAGATEAPAPSFTKLFSPDTVGPGSTSMLTFTINNSESTYALDEIAFDDELPSPATLAEPAFVSSSCGGTLELDEDDEDSEFDVRLTDGTLGAGATCTIVVNVAAPTTAGPYVNTSTSLTFVSVPSMTPGSSSPASDTLTVDTGIPGFTKSFLPTTVEFGGRSTLTFTIDNMSGSTASLLTFTDTLPAGMVVADPSNATTDCNFGFSSATVTADPGTDVISLSGGALATSATCTVSVDVIGGAIGALGNVSGPLDGLVGVTGFDGGKASAVLEVTGFATLLQLEKKFTDDPVPPGGTVMLEFMITNKSRDFPATAISLTDTIDPMSGLTGLAPAETLPKAACGGTLDFAAGDLTLTGGSLPKEGSCTFSVLLSVPSGATPSTYTNTAGPASGTIDGTAEDSNVAGDQLFVVAFPVLTKEFTDDPVGAGGTATLEFTIFNTSTSAITEISFLDPLTADTDGMGNPSGGFLPSPVSVGLPPVPDPPCNGTSDVMVVSFGASGQALRFTGGELAATDGVLGGADTCSFTVTLDIPEGFPGGSYLNTTEPITAKVGMTTVTGKRATDTIEILGAPQLTKEFTNDPALPGGTVTLLFTLENLNLDDAASAIAFDDDLGAALSGLTIASYGPDTCGGTPSGQGTGMFGYTGGSLPAADPGPATCTIELTLDVPDIAGGSFVNQTGKVTATVAGVATEGTEAEDTLVVAGLQFTKAFSGDPVIPGGTATLTFTIDNTAGATPADDATDIGFSDDLDVELPGLAATTIPPSPIPGCGGSSSLVASSGGTLLTFSDGAVAGGATCSFSVTVTVPATITNPTPPPPGSIPTPDGFYLNRTGSLSATIGGSGATLPPAIDAIEVNSTLLEITKEFINDPVVPGGTATARFTLTNLSATETVTDIAFSDDFGAALTGLVATGAANDCGGMSPTVFPSSTFDFAAGGLLPGISCTVTVTVDVPDPIIDPPPYVNTTSGVTGKVDASLDVFGDPDSDELLVQLLAISKDFTDDPTTATGTVTLEFTLTNLGAAAVSDLAFTDDLATVIPGLEATTLPPVGICGPGSELAGTSFLSLTGGSLGPGASCVIPVTLTVPASATKGVFLNTSSQLREGPQPVAPAAKASLVIEPPPTFAKEFAPDTIPAGGVSTLTFTIDNAGSSVTADDLTFTDNFPAGVVIANPTNASTTCGAGMGNATPGAGSFSFVGGSVAGGASCTVTLNVTSVAADSYVNMTSDLTSTSGNSGTATDTLVVTPPPPPAFSKVFSPDPVGESFETTLTFTIDNSASLLAATSLAFLDMLPVGLEVAAVPMATNTCGGSLVAAPESVSISLSGGTVGPGASCKISVKVLALSAGVLVNTTGDLTSSSGNSGTASDSLTVIGCTAADGANLTLENDAILAAETREVCNTIQVKQHFQVVGPGGDLTLRAGVTVIFFSGFEVKQLGKLTVEIDPSLIP